MTDTAAEINAQFQDAFDRELKCAVLFTTYRGHSHPDGRPDKSIHILAATDANGDEIVVMVGDRGKRGPSLLKIGTTDDIKTFKSSAFFSLKGAGYEKSNTRTTTGEITTAWDLWYACFDEHHRASLEAKRAFLRLIGVEVGSSFDALMSKAGAVKVEPPKKPDPRDAYADNPLYGFL